MIALRWGANGLVKKGLLIGLLILASVLPPLYLTQGTGEGSIKLASRAEVAGQSTAAGTLPNGRDGNVSPLPAPVDGHSEEAGVSAGVPTAVGAGADRGQDHGIPPQQATNPVQSSSPPPQPGPLPSTPASTPAYSIISGAMQKEMLDYLNAARTKAGLVPLILDDKLCDCAGLKSQEMACQGYFSHYSPTYGSPFKMMSACGIGFGIAGENIAQNFSVKASFEAFMNSDGHKANILNRDFRKVGLGFCRDSRHLYVTQMFTD